MKKTKKILAVLLALMLCFTVTACGNEVASTDGIVSTQSSSSEDTVPKIKLTLNVKNLDKEYTLNIETSGDTLYDALKENNLIEGEKGQYGFFVTTFDGVKADGSDKTYWTFRDANGEFFSTGVEKTNIKDGDVINIVRE